MRITIDNQDGLGAREYTCAVLPKAKGGSTLTIQRGLNVPSRCTLEMQVGVGGLPLPARRGRVVVSAEDGSLLFTGYLANEPIREYAGETIAGPVYRARLTAVSDEWLLDKLGPATAMGTGALLALDGRALLTRLIGRVAGTSPPLAVASGGAVRTVGAFAAQAVAAWSTNAAAAGSAAYAGYRAMNGQVMLQTAGTVTHALSDEDGTLSVAELQTGNVRELANDVTLSGEEEPAAYVSEIFSGDGTTTVFALSETVLRGKNGMLVQDGFEGTSFDPKQWVGSDPGSHLSLTGDGLTMSGGTGFDGQTVLKALDAIEMGGSLVVQMNGVVFGTASVGVLGGMYSGATTLPNCFAGFRVRQNSGVTVLVPVLNGVEAGTVFIPVAGHRYTLRMRLHCVEMLRVPQQYACMVDGVIRSFGGGGGIDAPMDAVFELVDEGAASNTPATVLYDSVAAGALLIGTPAVCEFAVVNAVQMFGSVAAVEVSRAGSAWVVSTLPDGSKQTRLMGVAGEGVDCVVQYGTGLGTSGAGASKVTFLSGRVPVAGELVTVSYRVARRAVARLADAASVSAEAAAGVPGTKRWLGKVLQPAARSSADCESAAQAVLAMATSRAAAVAGSYTALNPAEEIWPGDVLQVSSAGVTTALMVRSVELDEQHAEPEVRRYRVKFANDWATEWEDGLGLKLSEAVATDAVLPATAASGPATVLANLQALRVTTLSATTLQLDAGVAAPVGGGFEVRRRDWVFGAGGQDLVLRSMVRSFSIPRSAQVERFYVRMYDAGGLYSRWSSAVVVNAPVG